MDYIERKARCHCGITTFLVRFSKSAIPYDGSLCHCNTCRHISGEIAFHYLPIDGLPFIPGSNPRPVDPESTDLTGYRTSSNSVRYFCTNCSAQMFRCNNNTEWSVASAAISNKEEIATLKHHIWVGDTLDGGMADILREVGGTRLTRFAQGVGSEELPLGWRSEKLPTKEQASAQETLNGNCHCGKNRFYITRPNLQSAAPHASYPDLLFPKPETRLSTVRNPKDEKWWLFPRMRKASISGRLDRAPTTETKYLAGHCVCAQCRQGSGFEVHSWAFVPRINIFEAGHSEPIDFFNPKARPLGLKRYRTSPGRFREFCTTCGATAFWWTTGRVEVIDIAVGLAAQNEDGARVEDWLQWHKRISFAESGSMNTSIQGLVDGMASDPVEVASQN